MVAAYTSRKLYSIWMWRGVNAEKARTARQRQRPYHQGTKSEKSSTLQVNGDVKA